VWDRDDLRPLLASDPVFGLAGQSDGELAPVGGASPKVEGDKLQLNQASAGATFGNGMFGEQISAEHVRLVTEVGDDL
jgi:hypothetical protein